MSAPTVDEILAHRAAVLLRDGRFFHLIERGPDGGERCSLCGTPSPWLSAGNREDDGGYWSRAGRGDLPTDAWCVPRTGAQRAALEPRRRASLTPSKAEE